MSKTKSVRGFTLLEVLLVVGIIAILAGIVILAINPSKQLGDSRDAQRRSDVLTILNAVYLYSIDTNGNVPSTIPLTGTCGDTDTIIATSEATSTEAGVVELYSTLVTSSSTYITSIPIDPLATSSTGYGIVKTSSGRITVCAPLAENNTISITR